MSKPDFSKFPPDLGFPWDKKLPHWQLERVRVKTPVADVEIKPPDKTNRDSKE